MPQCTISITSRLFPSLCHGRVVRKQIARLIHETSAPFFDRLRGVIARKESCTGPHRTCSSNAGIRRLEIRRTCAFPSTIQIVSSTAEFFHAQLRAMRSRTPLRVTVCSTSSFPTCDTVAFVTSVFRCCAFPTAAIFRMRDFLASLHRLERVHLRLNESQMPSKSCAMRFEKVDAL